LVGEQFPTEEYARLQKRKERFEKLGLFSLSIFGFLIVAILLSKAVLYKIILFGEDLIFGAAFVALLVFGLLSVFFFNYPKLFMKFEKVNPRLFHTPEHEDAAHPTQKPHRRPTVRTRPEHYR